jgi:hypothetical protein
MRGATFGFLLLGVVGATGCAPRLIQNYAPRAGEVVFVVQEGASYQLGDCKRSETGQLSDCKTYNVVFQ